MSERAARVKELRNGARLRTGDRELLLAELDALDDDDVGGIFMLSPEAVGEWFRKIMVSVLAEARATALEDAAWT